MRYNTIVCQWAICYGESYSYAIAYNKFNIFRQQVNCGLKLCFFQIMWFLLPYTCRSYSMYV